MTDQVVAGMVRKVDLTPAEELRCVVSWLRHDVHLGPHTPGHQAIRRAADLLEKFSQGQLTEDNLPSRADEQIKLLRKIDTGVDYILQELQIALA